MINFLKNEDEPTLSHFIVSLRDQADVEVITPSDTDYDEARLVYNRMHNMFPALIIRTLNVDILRAVMAYAFRHHLILAIRGGGHHIGGFGTCDGGIVLDFSPFKTIQIDTKTNTVTVEPGVCLEDIDEALSTKGFIVPTGTVSQTGIAGLTLGGGIGWLTGRYGLTCDQLVGADVLLADGQLVQAEDASHHPLLWGLRGGGGNFGIVLKFKYKLNPLPETICGMGHVEWDQVEPVLNQLMVYLQTCPDSMTIAPIFTKDTGGRLNLRIDFCCADGTAEEVQRLLSLSTTIQWQEVRPWRFSTWQQATDQVFLPPMRGYWKAAYLKNLSSETIHQLCQAFQHSPAPRCAILIEHLHGQFHAFDQSTSAFPLRHCTIGILFAARWEDQEEDEANVQWVRESFHAIDPESTSGAYLNYTFAEDERAVHTLLNSTKTKITDVKSFYDPNNHFNRNHNVKPTRGS